MATNIKKKIARLAKDERGNTIIMFGLTIVPAVMFIGGAIDFGTAYKTKSKIQAAADAAVLGAVALGSTATSAQRETTAASIFTANVIGTGVTPSVVVSADGATVTVTASKDVPTSFLGIAHIETIHVTGNASASVSYTTVTGASSTTGGGKVCLLALDPGATNGFKSQGTPNVVATDCWGHTNSTQAAAIDGGGSAVVTGAGFSAVGSVTAAANGVYSPTPTGGASVVNDPFATVSAYAAAPAVYATTFATPTISTTCTASNLSLKKGTFSLAPGRYCGGINLQAGATVNFAEGEYIIDNGIFNVQSGSSVNGTNVMFYFSGAAARMTIIGGGTVNLTGRTTGNSYEGFLFIAHPDAWRGLTSNIQGGGTFKMEGMIYMPTQNILITGNGDGNTTSNFFSIVAKSFEFRGNGIFNTKTWNSASNMPDIMPTKPGTTIAGTTTTTISNVKLNAE